MVVHEIRYHPNFIRRFEALDPQGQQRVHKAAELFRSNPLHPSLRLHRLSGELIDSWSISVTLKIRIIFKRGAKGEVLFYSLGSHDIYR